MKELTKDKLNIKIYDSRQQMGESAAIEVCNYINKQLETKKQLNIVFAAAPSQNEFLEALVKKPINWLRINAFHMDEYIGLPKGAEQSFGYFLRKKIFEKVPFNAVHYIQDYGNTAEEMISNYKRLLIDNPVDITLMGVGENGHIAFNDPHVAFFDDKELIKMVDLDEACRTQQVHDGCFPTLSDVPTHALTLTIPTLMSSKYICCIVPGQNKAFAIKNMIQGEIAETCPASILRRHSEATLYCDMDSASYIV